MTDAGELYRALLVSGRLSSLRRLTYRCAERRCLLLDVIDAEPLGIVCHQTRYKLSREVNARSSSPRMRQRRTLDGDRHWEPTTKLLGETPLSVDPDLLGVPAPPLDLTCDHVRARLIAADFRADWEAGRHAISVRRDGSRYALQ